MKGLSIQVDAYLKQYTCPPACPNRCAVPNCHNVELCDIWKEHEEVKARLKEAKAKHATAENDVFEIKKDWAKKAHNIKRKKG